MTRPERLSPPLVVAVLGVNLWVGMLVLPLWHLHELGSMSHVAAWTAVAALVPLAVGTVLLARRRRGAGEALLVGYPALMFLPLALQPVLVGGSVFSPSATAIVGVSFASYIVGTSWACHRIGVSAIAASPEPLDAPAARRSSFWSVAILVFGAALALLVIGAGHLVPPATSAAAPIGGGGGRVIVRSVGALLLWTIAFFGILAPGLRAQRPRVLPLPSRGAALVWLLVVALAGVLLLLSSIE